MRRVFPTTLNIPIIVEYNVWNHDLMLETEIFFQIS